jgi:hypothetical protein
MEGIAVHEDEETMVCQECGEVFHTVDLTLNLLEAGLCWECNQAWTAH